MPPILTGTITKALYPGVSAWYGMAYDEHSPEYPQIFAFNKSSRNFEEEVGLTGFGLAEVKTEGESISYDTQVQGYVQRYTHIEYGKGFIITRNAVDDNLYDVVAKRRSRALAFSMRQTKEVVGANILNRAFSNSYVGPDGVELCSALHENVTGGTWANELATAADLSETALEQACIDIGDFEDDRGMKIAVRPLRLIIPIQLEFEAGRILTSDLQSGTANNDKNILKSTGKFPGGVHANHYLTDADAWFIITDAPDGMKHYERRADDFGADSDFDTENAKFKATSRYSFGCTDRRGIFGSPGG